MASTGINRRTGKVLRGFDHVRQSLEVIFTTRLASRVMRRSFGSGVPAVLGRPFTPSTMLNFAAAVIMAVDLWEPRYRVTRVNFPKPPNSVTAALQGHGAITIDGVYRPNALQGDFTAESAQQFVFGGQIVREAQMADGSLDTLAALGTPDIIETLDYEAILQARKDKFVALQGQLGVDYDVQDLETDPAIVLLEENADREIVLRARGNDIARDHYLYFARGAGLDHLGAFYDCPRLLGELDDRYKQRIILAIQGRSTGGTAPRYKLIAMSASLDVADANVYTTGFDPTVHVAIFSVSNNGIAGDALIAIVQAAMNDPAVRMVNDTIAVRAAVVRIVDVTAGITLLPDTPISLLDTLAANLPVQWAAEGGSGRDLTIDWIKGHLGVAGVYGVALAAPLTDQIMQDFEAVRIGVVNLTLAGRRF